MGNWQIFGIRLIVSIAVAFLISFFFFPGAAALQIAALAAGMLGLAYLLEYMKKGDKGEGHGK